MPVRVQPQTVTNRKTVITSRPSSIQNEFKYKLLDCCSDRSACGCGTFCPCIVGLHVAENLAKNGFYAMTCYWLACIFILV